jgi:hypothetical protein
MAKEARAMAMATRVVGNEDGDGKGGKGDGGGNNMGHGNSNKIGNTDGKKDGRQQRGQGGGAAGEMAMATKRAMTRKRAMATVITWAMETATRVAGNKESSEKDNNQPCNGSGNVAMTAVAGWQG